MTKEEYFNIAVEQLSVRAQRVISELEVTADNISYLSVLDLLPLKNCGLQTTDELLSLTNQINALYPINKTQSKDNKENMEDYAVYRQPEFFQFLLYRRKFRSYYIMNLLRKFDIQDFATFGNFLLHDEHWRQYRGCGEIYNILWNFYDDAFSIIVYYNIPECGYHFNLYSKYLDEKCQEIYEVLISKYTDADRQYIDNLGYKSLLMGNVESLRLEHMTNFQQKNIQDMLYRLRDKLCHEIGAFIRISKDELLLQSFFERIGDLSVENQDFIRQFKKKELHLPYFFIIYIALKFEKIFEPRSSKMYNAFIGIDKEEKGYSELAEENHLVKDRVRQILRNLGDEFNAYIESHIGDKVEIINTYPFLKYDFITSENTHFEKLAAAEHLPFSFSTFCSICTMLRNELEILQFYATDTGQLRHRDERLKRIYTTAYNVKISACNVMSLMQEIQRTIFTPKNNVISISDFCRNPRFWRGSLNEDILPQIVQFVEHLVKNVLHYQVVDGVIMRQPNDNDIKQVLYDCLKESDTPLSLIELFDAYRKKVPDSKYQSPKQIKSAIVRSDKIVVIGGKSLYTLAEREHPQTYKGSLYDAIEEVLKESDTPQLRDELITAALQLRPDSSAKSMRAIIASMLRTNKLKLFNEDLIGLPHVKYGKSFEVTQYETRKTFEEQLENLRAFVAKNNRFPFIGGGMLEERSLAVWYNRMHQNSALTTEQMVALYNFQQEIIAANIPQTADQFTFQKNCTTYKASVMRTGNLVSITQDERLYEWFRRSCSKYASLKDVRKVYFDELISFLAAFGYEINCNVV